MYDCVTTVLAYNQLATTCRVLRRFCLAGQDPSKICFKPGKENNSRFRSSTKSFLGTFGLGGDKDSSVEGEIGYVVIIVVSRVGHIVHCKVPRSTLSGNRFLVQQGN
jgi:hypothetical protein